MQVSLWILNVFVVIFAATPRTVEAQCSSITTCYEGGATSTPCTISSGGCPPCVTFSDNGCYVKMNNACPFGIDCMQAWTEVTTGPSASPVRDNNSLSTTPTPDTFSAQQSSSTTTPTSDSLALPVPRTSSVLTSDGSNPNGVISNSTGLNTSGTNNQTNGQSTASSGSELSVVFAIIGAAIGVIAVAVIFLTLVRRSKAAHDEDEDDIANTPPGFTKTPKVHASQSTSGNAIYASYNCSNRTTAMSASTGVENGPDASNGVSMNAVSYYNQQPPQNRAAPSPRVAGRAIPSQPVGVSSSTGMGRSYGGSQNFGTSGVGVANGFGVSGYGQPGVQAPPIPVQHVPMGGVAPSSHTRRESYEF